MHCTETWHLLHVDNVQNSTCSLYKSLTQSFFITVSFVGPSWTYLPSSQTTVIQQIFALEAQQDMCLSVGQNHVQGQIVEVHSSDQGNDCLWLGAF